MTLNGQLYGYIEDGYTRSGYIAEQQLLHPALCFTYRPCTAIEQNRIASAVSRASADPDRQEDIIAKALSDHLVDWDLKRRSGDTVPIEAAHVCRLQPQLFLRLYGIIMGSDGGDPAPEPTSEPKTIPRDTLSDTETLEAAEAKN